MGMGSEIVCLRRVEPQREGKVSSNSGVGGEREMVSCGGLMITSSHRHLHHQHQLNNIIIKTTWLMVEGTEAGDEHLQVQ